MTDKDQKEIFAKNLNKFVSSSGKKQNEICKDLGINTTTFNMWIKGNTMPSVRKIQILADYFHIYKTDLVDDKNNVPDYDPEIIELVDIYHKLPIESRYIVMASARAALQALEKRKSESYDFAVSDVTESDFVIECEHPIRKKSNKNGDD